MGTQTCCADRQPWAGTTAHRNLSAVLGSAGRSQAPDFGRTWAGLPLLSWTGAPASHTALPHPCGLVADG